MVEGLQLSGRGAVPSFEIAGRQPSSADPILFEVSCSVRLFIALVSNIFEVKKSIYLRKHNLNVRKGQDFTLELLTWLRNID